MKSSLTKSRNYYKPISLSMGLLDAFMASEQMHWLWTEGFDDRRHQDWKNVLTDGERDFLTKVFRFFTGATLTSALLTLIPTCPFSRPLKSHDALSFCCSRGVAHIPACYSFDRDDRYAGNCLQRVPAIRSHGGKSRFLPRSRQDQQGEHRCLKPTHFCLHGRYAAVLKFL